MADAAARASCIDALQKAFVTISEGFLVASFAKPETQRKVVDTQFKRLDQQSKLWGCNLQARVHPSILENCSKILLNS